MTKRVKSSSKQLSAFIVFEKHLCLGSAACGAMGKNAVWCGFALVVSDSDQIVGITELGLGVSLHQQLENSPYKSAL